MIAFNSVKLKLLTSLTLYYKVIYYSDAGPFWFCFCHAWSQDLTTLCMYLHNKQKLFLKRFSFAGNAVKNSIIVFYDFFIYMQSKAMLTKIKLNWVLLLGHLCSCYCWTQVYFYFLLFQSHFNMRLRRENSTSVQQDAPTQHVEV